MTICVPLWQGVMQDSRNLQRRVETRKRNCSGFCCPHPIFYPWWPIVPLLYSLHKEIFQQHSHTPCIFLTNPTRKALFEKFSAASNLGPYLWNFAHWVKILLHLWPGIVPANFIWNKSAKELLELPLWICLVSSSVLGALSLHQDQRDPALKPRSSRISSWTFSFVLLGSLEHVTFMAWFLLWRRFLKSKQMFLSLVWKPLSILLGRVSKEQLGVD